MALEFKRKGIPFKQKAKLEISYKGETLSKYYEADFVCYNKIILEIKAINELSGGHESQVINYL
ncbi:MAG: GxxExxY protein, partial [Bacteroidales bacterium]|nr:GxxExxY protein [Bacteroidales bacterium]